MPPEAEKSIQSVARYIADREPDPYLRIKALHDYVVSRVEYDLDVLKTGNRPLQDAQTVFATHKAVCEGYANLFVSLGQAIDIEAVYLEGRIRRDLAPLDLIPASLRALNSGYDWTLHAWNAVKVAGSWQLVDTTWDDGANSYSTNYLLPLPQVMIVSHLPNNPDWQLLNDPKSQDAFEDQPILTPEAFIDGLTIASPTKYETAVQDVAVINVQHPSNYSKKIAALFIQTAETEFSLESLLPTDTQTDKFEPQQCQSQQALSETEISCRFPASGDYQVLMFSLEEASSPEPRATPIAQLRFQASVN
ncbi:hypothetical protein H6F67_01855 [Microcoleus sp. FACHB-1515]|uniref:transglutaminase domain-containing protein n=1 Tax=Cyanophyceae TaxID=3028117 RepID=UPI0019CBD0C3|nr:transglutaminase domain-containing protein [Microcoleus sp. FACHB-1515]MBD2088606.1 hypothetical protein [Microcoleus sp. FACHB-1515]